jgi:Flp pilus assembly protein TadB
MDTDVEEAAGCAVTGSEFFLAVLLGTVVLILANDLGGELALTAVFVAIILGVVIWAFHTSRR